MLNNNHSRLSFLAICVTSFVALTYLYLSSPAIPRSIPIERISASVPSHLKEEPESFEAYLGRKGDDDFKPTQGIDNDIDSDRNGRNKADCSLHHNSHSSQNFKTAPTLSRKACAEKWKGLRTPEMMKDTNGFKVGYCNPLISASSLALKVHNLSTYTCSRHTSNLLEQQYHSSLFASDEDKPLRFDPRYFLSLIANRELILIGDSLAKQLFHALDVELDNYQNKLSAAYTNPNIYGGNGTHTFYSRFVHVESNSNSKKFKVKLEPLWDPPPDYKAARRVYADFNTSIFWCNDGTLHEFAINDQSGGQWQFCTHRILQPPPTTSTILVIGIGAHYKPPDAESLADYHTKLSFQTQVFQNFSIVIRDRLHQAGYKSSQIMWQLVPHVGNIDERTAQWKSEQHKDGGTEEEDGGGKDEKERKGKKVIQHEKGEFFIKHQDGLAWSHPQSQEAKWVQEFNRVIRKIADIHGDHVIDVNTLSMQLMSHAAVVSKSMMESDNLDKLDKMRRVYKEGVKDGKPAIATATTPIRLHADSLHWCAGGLFRASLLLLQNNLEYNKKCFK